MALLDINNIDVSIGDRTVVTGASFTLNAGEVLSVVGPNGAGKTSLLRAISSDLAPSSGTLSYNSRPLLQWTQIEKARTLAVLTQANPLSFAFTVAEVVALGRTPHSTGALIDGQVCNEAMTALDVACLADRVYPTLSGGEKQRVQLARVMAQIWRDDYAQDRLLLLDEPVTSLDLGHQRQLMRAIRAFANSGVGVVMVVHDITLAAAYSDRLLAIDDGQIIAQGTPAEVVTESMISRLFKTEVKVIPHPVSGSPIVVGV